VAKVLATRLGLVMDKLISKNQSAFIKGRLLVDGVLVVNEVVDLAKRAKVKCMIFKVDFEKAYDSVNWNFLIYMMKRFGFAAKWIDWVRACVCAGNLSVLVNGSPTSEVNIARGLKQGDPLAPFLFLLVVEGLGLLMNRAVSLGFFKPFVIKNSGVVVSHLQYADDTLFVGDACVENLWCMKAILRWFELMSGLKVNFAKSRLVGVKVDDSFMGVASNFLNCKLGKLPFKYLGLPVGANPRKDDMWKPVLEILQKRLNSWQNRFVSLGGRVVLINSVLAAIPLFYLSLFKMPMKTWKKIVSIQRNFLWGGASNKTKIAWVKWVDVCRGKDDGGLGVKNLRLMNIALLTKWRWRLLTSKDSLCSLVLKAKYGENICFSPNLANEGHLNIASIWWKDLCTLGRISIVDDGDWCRDIMIKTLGNGGGTRFWVDIWVGNIPLCDLFPRLFSVSLQPNLFVNQMGEWREEGWRWNFKWRRKLFVWEDELLKNLLVVLGAITLSSAIDSWRCSIGVDGGYTVKDGYGFLSKNFLPEVDGNGTSVGVVNRVWESLAPMKVIIFSWQLLLQKLPTRYNLSRRGVFGSPSQAFCARCQLGVETEAHLFMTCSVAVEVWIAIYAWIGLSTVVPGNVSLSFEAFGFPFKCKRRRKGLNLIWQTVTWSLWLARNTLIFDGKTLKVYDIVDAIKRRSLEWFIARKFPGVVLYYEWENSL
jgi:hypothetical protein